MEHKKALCMPSSSLGVAVGLFLNRVFTTEQSPWRNLGRVLLLVLPANSIQHPELTLQLA